jgi:hypothetical protein
MQPGNYAILHQTIDLLIIEPGNSKIYRLINIEPLEQTIVCRFMLEIKLQRLQAVFRSRICRIRKFLGLPEPDPLVGGTDTDPDPFIIKQNLLEKPLFLLFSDFL